MEEIGDREELKQEEHPSESTSSQVHEKPKRKLTRKELEKRLEELDAQVESLKNELADTKDKLLRALADFDNYKKRIARERDEMVRCANEVLILSLLDVIDNIERALESVKAGKDSDALIKGIELIYQNLKEVLSRQGLCPIECVGKSFDPNLHEAVMALEKEGIEPQQVVEELQKGYILNGKVIRPSRVVVSK
ncbi:MAG: nucleotide exchange factor GrpE [bacterium]